MQDFDLPRAKRTLVQETGFAVDALLEVPDNTLLMEGVVFIARKCGHPVMPLERRKTELAGLKAASCSTLLVLCPCLLWLVLEMSNSSLHDSFVLGFLAQEN